MPMDMKDTIDFTYTRRLVMTLAMSSLNITSAGGGIVVVSFARPPANAMDAASLEELTVAFDRLAADLAVKAAILTGQGNIFSAGLDLKAAPNLDLAGQRRLIAALNDCYGTLYAWPKPLVAAVNGHVIAGGMVAALCTDYRLVADVKLQASLAEIRVGVRFPVAPLQAAIGELAPAAARRMVLLGETLGAREAVALGVFDELVPAGGLRERAVGRAQRLAELPPKAFAATKRDLRGAALARIAEARAGADPCYAEWLGEEMKSAARAALQGPALRRDA